VTEPRVLFVGHGAERTGPPIFLLRLLRWMDAAGKPPPTVVVARDGELVADYRRLADVVVLARGPEPLEPVAAALRRLGRAGAADATADRWLRERLRRLPAHDVIHVNGCSPANARAFAALPLATSTTPMVLHVHELDIGLRHNLTAEQRRLLLGRADAFLAVAQAVATNLIDGHDVPADRVSVHPGFVDPAPVGRNDAEAAGRALRAELGIGADAFVIGTAALPDWRKAPDLLLRAAWTIRRRRPDIDLHVVWAGGTTDGTDAWQVGHEADQLGLGERFHHLAHRDDPTAVHAALDLYVSAAREDAFPLAVLEAAQLARPTVAFDVGGVAELVRDDAGQMVDWPDTDALATAIVALHDDPDRRRRAGSTAAARVEERYVTSVCAPRLWQAVCETARGPRRR
jgi:glycosyltransferase involved in cell wall biosynthesis